MMWYFIGWGLGFGAGVSLTSLLWLRWLRKRDRWQGC